MNRFAVSRLLSALTSAFFIANVASATLIPHPFNSLTSSPPSTSVFSSISIANDGAPLGTRTYFSTLNLSNNDLIVTATTEAAALSNFANVTDMVRSGYDHGDWLGTGITSSIAAADHAAGYESTAIGVILNDDGTGSPIYTVWDGKTVNQFDVLVKYTFFGDTFLRGFVDSSDLSIVNSDIGSASGWVNGEFNYTGGTVSHIDLLEVNRTLTYENRYPINTPVADPPPPLPEPSSAILAVLGILAVPVCFRRSRLRG
jgi:hypothetical protein